MKQKLDEKLGKKITFEEDKELINWKITKDVAQVIKSSGYKIANSDGVRVILPEYNIIGILKEQKPIKRTLFGFEWEVEQLGLHIGDLVLEDNNARHDTNWILKIYGRNYVYPLIDLIKKASEPYDVQVKAILKSENPHYEELERSYEY